MSNEVLNALLREYGQKKLKAELDLEKRKIELYEKIPRLAQIEEELNNFAISTAKNILNMKKNTSLNSKAEPTLENLKEKANLLKFEKAQILSSINLDLTYLQPFYECKICKDTGYVTDDNNKTSMCNCLKQKLLNNAFNKSNMYNLEKENFSTFNEQLFSDEVNIAKYKFNISPRTNIINIKNKCIEFIENFENSNYKNLLFTGNTGCGKTFMSNCIARELLKNGKTVLYQTAPVLLESVIDYKMSKQKNNLENVYKSILESDLLIIDDLGTESLNSMKLSELFTILNTRILNLNNKITKTIISTNLNINDIFNNYEERIGSRIAGYYDIYYFFGDDMRFLKVKNIS